MISNIPNIQKPDISPDFTVDDIHKIRVWHYEITKGLSFEERKAFYEEGASEFKSRLKKFNEPVLST